MAPHKISVRDVHNAAVAQLGIRLASLNDPDDFRINHGSTSTTRPYLRSERSLDLRGFTRILSVEPEERRVLAEPNVAMSELVQRTLTEHNLIPKVVPEFKGITVGGAFSGVSGESTMFRHGLFQNTVSRASFLLRDGTRVEASRDGEHADLLQWCGGTMGTIAIGVLFEIELIPAKPYVSLALTLTSLDDFAGNVLDAIEGDRSDFIDAISFDASTAVLMQGRFAETPGPERITCSWFSHQVKTTMQSSRTASLSLETTEYLFRYDHGAFWGGELALKHFGLPNSRLTRALAKPWLSSALCYDALHRGGFATRYVVQDFAIPASKLSVFVDKVRERLPGCRLFLCPGQSPEHSGLTSMMNGELVQRIKGERLFAVGVYAPGPQRDDEFRALHEYLTTAALGQRGLMLFYAHFYGTKQQFWAPYNRPGYEKMRARYGAADMPDLYAKVSGDMKSTIKYKPVRGVGGTVLRHLHQNRSKSLAS